MAGNANARNALQRQESYGTGPTSSNGGSGGGQFVDPGILSGIQSFFQNPFPTIGAAITRALTPTPVPANPYYQVKKTDASLTSVSNGLNVSLPTLVAANGGIKSLPPAGSYIATGLGGNPATGSVQGANQVGGYLQTGPAGSNTYDRTLFSAVPASLTAPTAQQPGRGGTPAGLVMMQNAANVLDNAVTMRGYVPDSNLIPKNTVIPIAMFTAAGYTPQDAQAMGLTVVGQNLVATGAAPSVGGPNAYTGAAGTPGNRSGTAIRNAHGTLVNANMRKRNDYGQAVAAVEASNAANTVSTVLGLRLGSG